MVPLHFQKELHLTGFKNLLGRYIFNQSLAYKQLSSLAKRLFLQVLLFKASFKRNPEFLLLHLTSIIV